MNAYEKLNRHLKANVYTKGVNKGDAPLSQRGKAHLRVIKYDDYIAVRFHQTDILTVTPDGAVVLDCEGYSERPTTQAAVNEALSKLYGGIHIGRSRIFSHSQPILYTYKSHTGYIKRRYYDGITLDSDGNITSKLHRFERKQRDKAQVAEFVQGMEDSGFKACFKVLHNVSEGGRARNMPNVSIAKAITEEVYANSWADIVAYYTWETQYVRVPLPNLPYNMERTLVKHPAPKAWAALMNACKRTMTEVVLTDVTEIK